MSNTANIITSRLIMKRRDGQTGQIAVTSVLNNTGGGSASQAAILAAFNYIFEIVNPGEEDVYLRVKVPIGGDQGIQAFTDSGQLPPGIWESLPIASATTLGAIKVGTGLTIDEYGVLNNTAGGGGGGSGVWGAITGTITDQTDLVNALGLKAPLASPTFTGTVSGITKAMVGLENIDNTADTDKPVSTAQQTALNLKANIASPTFTGTVTLPLSFKVGTITVTATGTELNVLDGITASVTELNYTDGVTSNIQTQLNLKAPLASPTFTGTVSGITAAMVGLGNVTNESKATMFASPTFTGTVAGVTAAMVGLGNVTNESKATMFTAPTFTGTVSTTTVHGTTLLIDHIGEHTGGHLVVFDNNITILNASNPCIKITDPSNGSFFAGVASSQDAFSDVANIADLVIGGYGSSGGNLIYRIGTTSNGGAHIWTTAGSPHDVERMRLTPDGKLGINVVDPDEFLEVNGNIHVTGNIYATGVIAAYSDTDPGSNFWDYMPVATATTLGGIKVGTTLSIVNGVLNALAGGVGVTDGDKGDITVTGSGAVWTIDNGVVSLAKMASMATASLIYRKTAGAGAPEVNTLATLKTDLGLTGTNSGDQTLVSLGLTATAAELNALDGITATVTELNYTDGVTSNIQTQLNLKAPLASPTFTGTVVLPSTTSIGTVSSTEIGYLDGVTSALQTQINAKSPLASPTFTGTVTLPLSFKVGTITVTATGTELNVLDGITASVTELNYTDGVTSNIQTQLNLKAPLASPTFTGTVVLPATTSIGNVSSTEIGYLDGVTSAIQTQLGLKAPIADPVFTTSFGFAATNWRFVQNVNHMEAKFNGVVKVIFDDNGDFTINGNAKATGSIAAYSA